MLISTTTLSSSTLLLGKGPKLKYWLFSWRAHLKWKYRPSRWPKCIWFFVWFRKPPRTERLKASTSEAGPLDMQFFSKSWYIDFRTKFLSQKRSNLMNYKFSSSKKFSSEPPWPPGGQNQQKMAENSSIFGV